MRLVPAEAQARFSAARVLHLATADRNGVPHLVPCTFVIDPAGRIVVGVDNKPKSTRTLLRLRNIEQNPRVSLLADDYDEDWNRLWWARADGAAVIEHRGAAHDTHWRQLSGKYPQYEGQTLDGPVITVTVDRWSGWAYG